MGLLTANCLSLDVPPLTRRVTDKAGVLSPLEVQKMEEYLKNFEQETSNQIAVLIIPSLEGEVLEDYSIKVARKWALGTKEKDNGVLLLIAVKDRKIRIEVGLGLQGALTDALSSRIIRNEMAPLLRRGHENWDKAVWNGIKALAMATKGEYKGTPRKSVSKKVGGFGGLFLFGIFFWVW